MPIVVNPAAAAGHDYHTLDLSELQVLHFFEIDRPPYHTVARSVAPWWRATARTHGECRLWWRATARTHRRFSRRACDLVVEVDLDRNSEFPVALRPVFAVSAISDDQLASLKAQAMALATVLGFTAPASGASPSDSLWYFSDTALRCFGEAVPTALMIEAAVRRSLRAPDFEHAEVYLEHMMDAPGGASASKFEKRVADRQQQRAIILTQCRLLREEGDAVSRRRGGGAADSSGGHGQSSAAEKKKANTAAKAAAQKE